LKTTFKIFLIGIYIAAWLAKTTLYTFGDFKGNICQFCAKIIVEPMKIVSTLNDAAVAEGRWAIPPGS